MDNKIYAVVIVCLVLLFCIQAYYNYVQDEVLSEHMRVLDKYAAEYDMQNEVLVENMKVMKKVNNLLREQTFIAASEDTELAGIYRQDAFYCVWTEGQTEEEILRTSNHEIIHAVLNENITHFCDNPTAQKR